MHASMRACKNACRNAYKLACKHACLVQACKFGVPTPKQKKAGTIHACIAYTHMQRPPRPTKVILVQHQQPPIPTKLLLVQHQQPPIPTKLLLVQHQQPAIPTRLLLVQPLTYTKVMDTYIGIYTSHVHTSTHTYSFFASNSPIFMRARVRR